MAQSNIATTTSMPKTITGVVILCYIVLLSGLAAKALFPNLTEEKIKWIKPEAALKLSIKQNKPIFYFFTADWCPPCKLMKQMVFNDGDYAKQLQEQFIPVKIVNRDREDGKNLPVVDSLQEKYHVESFPTLVVIAPSKVDNKIQKGYPGQEKTKQFLSESYQWSLSFNSSKELDWKPLSQLDDYSYLSKKPTLLFFLDEKKDISPNRYLNNHRIFDMINNEFDSYLICINRQFKKATAEETKLKEQIIEDLNIHDFPTMVVLPDDKSIPHYLFDLSSSDHTEDFLDNILEYIPEEKHDLKEEKKKNQKD